MQKDREEDDYLPNRYFKTEVPHKPSKIIPKTIANITTQGTKTVVGSSRVGWWLTHKFSKRSTMDITHFCGWEELERLIEQCETEEEEALIATLFLTGGRASEVLSLRHEQFEEKKDFILIKGMLVLKQKKPENRYRQVLIRKNNFLIPYMMQWVNKKKKGKLFWFKYGKLYKTVVGIDKDWFPHKFRGMRASQLATETGINTILLLMKWFGWTSEKMPAHYARMSTKELENAFIEHERKRNITYDGKVELPSASTVKEIKPIQAPVPRPKKKKKTLKKSKIKDGLSDEEYRKMLKEVVGYDV